MKYFIQHPDATGRFDPPGVDTVRQTPGRVEKADEADVIFIPVARFNEFRFDDRLLDIQRPWVLFDWCEFGWDDPGQTSYMWGRDRLKHEAFQNEEWMKFDSFVKANPPLLTFQRELLEKDRGERVVPLEYLNWLPEVGNDPKDDFNKRPIDALFNWGRSSESRMLMHGAFFSQAQHFGYDVITDWSHIDQALKENICGSMKVVTIHVPHFARIDALEVQKFSRRSRVGVILGGAGTKTFRDGETCQDFIMARPRNDLAWTYPWDIRNSIVLPKIESVSSAADAVQTIMDALMRPDIYDLYCEAMANAQNYRPETYCRRHISANVEKHL